MVSHEIETYKVFLMSQDQSKYAGRYATILLKLKGTKEKAFLYFYDANKLPSENKKSENNFKTYWKMSQYDNVLDILRNEKPLFFYFDEGSKVANVQTTDEPVGEEEGN